MYYTMYNYTHVRPCFFYKHGFCSFYDHQLPIYSILHLYMHNIYVSSLHTCTHTYTHTNTHTHTHTNTHNYMAKPLDLKNTQTFDRGYGYIVLEEVQCRGNESNLSQCPHAGIKSNNCIHRKVIGVICGKMTSIHM